MIMSTLTLTLFCVLLLTFFFGVAQGVTCPHCFGNFASCDYENTSTCPSVNDVTTNTSVIVAGVGSLVLKRILKNRYLRLFTRFAFDTFVSLAKRPEPGAPFEILITTTTPEIVQAITNLQTTGELALLGLATLREESTDAEVRAKLKDRMDSVRQIMDLRAKTGMLASDSRHDSGVFSFLWAKLSEFVVKDEMKLRLGGDTSTSDGGSSSTSSLVAKIHPPKNEAQFFEMLNLFIMYSHALGLCNCVVVTDFFQQVVFDSMNLRDYSWQVAFCFVVLMFRRIEDSGGRVTLGGDYPELLSNIFAREAEAKCQSFFRTDGGNPGGEGRHNDSSVNNGIKWNGKCSAKGSPCSIFNVKGAIHGKSHLHSNGTCKFNHVCDHFVTDQGKGGKCQNKAGTPGHTRATCDNPNKCDEALP